MKKITCMLIATMFSLSLFAQVETLKLGESINYLKLRNVNDTDFDLNQLPSNNKGMIVVFMTNTCDHCIMYRQRIKDLDKKYKALGFPLIAISPLGGMPEKWPLDAFPAMKEIAKKEKYNFPFLSDDHLFYTNMLGVEKTPTTIVFEREGNSNRYIMRFRGAIDDNDKNPTAAVRKYVAETVDALLKKK